MDDENGTQASAQDRLLNANQVVAWNLARLRRAAGLTQGKLGDILGWTNQAVSEAERSFEGKRTREFDAQELVAIALAFGVPLIALFLPPDDDGDGTRYLLAGPGGEEHDMGTLMAWVVMPDSASDASVMEAYRRRLRVAVGRYLDDGWVSEAGSWLRDIEPAELRAERADRLRAFADSRIAEAAELLSMAQAIDPEPAQPADTEEENRRQ